MATQTPMLPGLGGPTAGMQPKPGTLPKPNVTQDPLFTQTTPGRGQTMVGAVPGTSMPISPTATPATLPTPQVSNIQDPKQAQNALQMGPGGSLPAGLTPMGTVQPQNVTDMLNVPPPDTSHLNQFGSLSQSPAQTNDTAKKFNDFFAEKKGTESPATNPMRDQTTQSALDQHAPTSTPDPEQQFMDSYMKMNPAVKTIFDNIQKTIDSQTTKQTLVDQYKTLESDPGTETLGADKLALMDLNNVMKGTEDDIRAEITKSGGFATNSQVQALTTARNKTLLIQAAQLQDQIKLKEDYVNQIMHFTELDRAEVDKQVSNQLGLYEKEAEITQQMDTAAKDAYWKQLTFQQTQDTAQTTQYDKNLTNLGGDYTAFASTIPAGLKPKVESLMGLAPGTLSNPDELAYLTASSLKQQQLAQAGQKIQISLNSAGSLEQYRAALTELAGARTVATNANAVNSTIKSLYGTANANPITAYRTASIWIGNVNAAYSKAIDPTNVNKGPSDLELIDAAVKLNNGGQQVTQVQVDALQNAIGLPGKITVAGGKVTGISGILDTGTRTAIRDLATSNLIQKRIAATEATDNINSTLTQRGTPTNYNLPQIQAAMIPEGTVNTGTAADGMTTVYLLQDGSVVDSEGTTYNSNGYPL